VPTEKSVEQLQDLIASLDKFKTSAYVEIDGVLREINLTCDKGRFIHIYVLKEPGRLDYDHHGADTLVAAFAKMAQPAGSTVYLASVLVSKDDNNEPPDSDTYKLTQQAWGAAFTASPIGQESSDPISARAAIRMASAVRLKEQLDTLRQEPHLSQSIARIKTVLRASGLGELINKLPDGLTVEEIESFESRVGFSVPNDLRILWSIHAGQGVENGCSIRDKNGNGFFDGTDFLGPRESLEWCAAVTEDYPGFIREPGPEYWAEYGINKEEADSDDWICFARGDDLDYLVVNAKTGRVFMFGRDDPPVKLVADSIADWLNEYATKLEKQLKRYGPS